MRKILLSTLLASCALGVSAASTDYFKVVYDNREIKDGVTVNITEGDAYDGMADYMPHFSIVNVTTDIRNVYFAMEFTGKPSAEELGDGSGWGNPQLCFDGSFGDLPAACLPSSPNPRFVANYSDASLPPSDYDGTLNLMPEVLELKDGKLAVYKLTIIALDDDKEELADGTFSCTLAFGTDGAGVGEIGADGDYTTEYYNLQGVKVSNPENGIYIVRRGSKVSKEVIR